MKKAKNNTYQVKHFVKAIISQDVVASSPEEAREKAEEKMKKNIFVVGIDVIDEKTEFSGIDTNNHWESIR